MDRVELKHISVRPRTPFAGWALILHRWVLVLFALDLFLVCARLCWPGWLFHDARWPDGLLVILAVATTIASLSRQVPAQNAVLASILIGFLGAIIQLVGAIAAVPFGPFVYNKESIGSLLLDPLPWPIPLFWVVALLNARGVARLILRKFRYRRNYGFAVMGLTVVLIVLLELNFEPYAVQVKDYWSWKPTKLALTWYSAPLTNFIGWAVSSLLILLFVTPALINKSPVKRPPAFQPLVVWTLLNLLFVVGAALHGLRTASAVTIASLIVVVALALVGSRFQ